MTSDPTRWTRVEALFEEALGLPAPDREAFVDREAGGDAALADEVRALLDADAEAGAYFADVARSLSGTAPLAEGDRVGPYRITGRLGEGGMGTVYRAERADGAFEREVALKVLRDARGGDVRRFLAERQILARLDHPAIGRLYDGGIDDRGHPFLAMELVEGEPITAYCDRHRLGVEARLGLFRQVCEAVQFAHGRLVVHRDLKPSNVLVASGDSGEGASGKGQGGNAPSPFSLPSSPRVKLLDFGVAKLLDTDIELTQTGAAPHTPAYAAPEQVRGEEVTTATDVYALGVLLYELLTGTRPYRLTNRRREAVQQAILHAEPTQPSTAVLTPTSEADPAGTAAARATEPTRLRRRLQGDLDRIVLKALRKEPERRYEGAAALGRDVQRHLDGLPVEARPESVGYRVGKFVRRHRGGVALAALALVGLLGGLGAALWQASVASEARDRAEAEARAADRATDLLVDVFGTSDPNQARGDTLNAYDILGRGLALVDTLGAEPAVQARLLHALGNVYGNLGDYDRAATLLRRAIAARRDGRAAPEDLTLTLSNLGVALQRGGDADGAVSVLEEAVARHEAAAAPDAFRFANTLSDLCLALHEQGDYAAAEAACRRALAVGGEAPSEATAFRHSNLGLALEGGGELAAAADAYRRATQVRASLPAPNPIEAAYTEGNLGRVLARLGETDEAEASARRGVARMRGVVGDRHPDLAVSLTDLGQVLELDGRFDEALAAYDEALSIQQASVGADHPEAITTLNNIGVVHARAGRNARAVEVLTEALDRRRRAQGDDHPEVATGLNNVATLEDRLGRTAQALARYEEAVTLSEATFGPDHATTGSFRYNLGRIYARVGRGPEAEAALRQALATFEATFPADHFMIGYGALEVGRGLVEREAFDEARPLLERAKRLIEATDRPDAPERLADAEALLRRTESS